MPTEEEIQEEIEMLKRKAEQHTRPKEEKGSVIGLGVLGLALASKIPKANKITTVKPKHSNSERILKGTRYLNKGNNQGKVIKEIIKNDWDNKRIVKFTDGSKITTNKQILRAHIDVELDRVYKPKAMKGIRSTKAGKAKVTIGGSKQGERVEYANKTNAKRALDNYYSEDYEQYKQGKYPVRCPKHK